MNEPFDPVPWFAGGALLLAAALGAWWALDDAPAAGPARPQAVAPEARPAAREPAGQAGGTAGQPAGSSEQPAGSAGWVPPSAREALSRADAPRDQPPDGPDCDGRASVVDLAKNTAVQFEAQLRSATALSDAEEAAIGERMEREAARAEPFAGKWDLPADRQRYGNYLQSLVDLLAKQAARPGLRFRVHVVRDDNFNAFAMAGGVLAVHTAVLEGRSAVADEAELAAVLGHEIAHVEKRHAAAAYQYARTVLGPDADEAAVIVHALKLPISTEYEHEADARGLEISAAAQYDPFAASRLWVRHGRERPAERESGLGALGKVIGVAEEVLHSHPPPKQRCARTREIAARINGAASVDRWYRGQSNVRDRVIGPQHPY